MPAVDAQRVPAPHAVDRSPLVKLAGSISAKVVVLTIIAALVAVAVGVIGWAAIGGLQGRVDRLGVVQHVLRNQAEADEGNRAIPVRGAPRSDRKDRRGPQDRLGRSG